MFISCLFLAVLGYEFIPSPLLGNPFTTAASPPVLYALFSRSSLVFWLRPDQIVLWHSLPNTHTHTHAHTLYTPVPNLLSLKPMILLLADIIFFFFFAAPRFELRASHLVGRHSTASASPPALFVIFFFLLPDMVSRTICPGLTSNHYPPDLCLLSS
jgi:hypothetical protein